MEALTKPHKCILTKEFELNEHYEMVQKYLKPRHIFFFVFMVLPTMKVGMEKTKPLLRNLEIDYIGLTCSDELMILPFLFLPSSWPFLRAGAP